MMDICLNSLKLLGLSFFILNPAPTDDETLEYFTSVIGNSGPDVDNYSINSVYRRLEQGRIRCCKWCGQYL